MLRRDSTTACECTLKSQCSTGPEAHYVMAARASVRHDHGPDGRDALLDQDALEGRCEMARSVLAYNRTRDMNIVGIEPIAL